MASFFDKNIGAISGRVQAYNHLYRELESILDFSKPDYENIKIIIEEAYKRGVTLQPRRAAKLLCRIKRKQAGWTITNQNEKAC